METRLLGATNLRVTRLGLGMAALGRPGYITLGHAADLGRDRSVDALRAHAHAVLDAAWDVGVRYIDTARSYGRAEAFVADWLATRQHDAHAVVIGSKWGYTYTAGWSVVAEAHEMKDHTLPTLERQLAESRGLLGTRLRLYQIHSATVDSGVLDRPVLLDRLASLKTEQEPLAIGLTLSGPDSATTLERALRVERDGRRLFDTVQATWNVLEPSLTPLLSAARAAGLGVIVKEALANGRLTSRNADPAFAPTRALLERVAARLGCAVDQLALAYALAQPWADCVLSGAATVGHIRSHAAAISVRIDAAARDALAALAEPTDVYWGARAMLAWN